jgi:hypothetical protein
MRLVYVFDVHDDDPESYVVRLPELLARVFVKLSRRPLDYWTSPAGI